ncbi:hypothetical protein PV05_01081 [Exophiala xenobiotica]|uniref:Uncharacterized protein n=1 Tax=Exophiala xenobiotica TaxID=348802 RepID=A0A0D2F1U2_9EURO|nr:uncharacterized protein PV05_01081 [Exophiala xenobiotica]KIW60900.1 hypothetical protein PV05_01081 [Exophiala xenobiotica]
MPDFKDREQALENEYIRKREAEKAAAHKGQQGTQSMDKSGAPTTNPATTNSAQLANATLK